MLVDLPGYGYAKASKTLADGMAGPDLRLSAAAAPRCSRVALLIDAAAA